MGRWSGRAEVLVLEQRAELRLEHKRERSLRDRALARRKWSEASVAMTTSSLPTKIRLLKEKQLLITAFWFFLFLPDIRGDFYFENRSFIFKRLTGRWRTALASSFFIV